MAIVVTVLGLNLLGDGMPTSSIRNRGGSDEPARHREPVAAIGDTPILKGMELSVAPGEVMGWSANPVRASR
jgi:hypothetical protein